MLRTPAYTCEKVRRLLLFWVGSWVGYCVCGLHLPLLILAFQSALLSRDLPKEGCAVTEKYSVCSTARWRHSAYRPEILDPRPSPWTAAQVAQCAQPLQRGEPALVPGARVRARAQYLEVGQHDEPVLPVRGLAGVHHAADKPNDRVAPATCRAKVGLLSVAELAQARQHAQRARGEAVAEVVVLREASAVPVLAAAPHRELQPRRAGQQGAHAGSIGELWAREPVERKHVEFCRRVHPDIPRPQLGPLGVLRHLLSEPRGHVDVHARDHDLPQLERVDRVHKEPAELARGGAIERRGELQQAWGSEARDTMLGARQVSCDRYQEHCSHAPQPRRARGRPRR